MSEITDILSEINIPRDKAILLEHALDKKYVVVPGFPSIEWEKTNMIPIQQEQIRASERMESLRAQMMGFKEEMHARFQAMESRFSAIDSKFSSIDSKFAAMDDKFKMMMWMIAILLAMSFATFSKLFFGF
jgi:hypothetical protein